MQREEMLAKVQGAYEARRTGDFSTLHQIVADGAEFSYAGDQALLSGMPGADDLGVHDAARQLFETIELRTLEPVQSVAEGNRIAILWRTDVAVPGKDPFDTLMFDLWEFNDAGKICRGTQFVDTAKFIDVMRG